MIGLHASSGRVVAGAALFVAFVFAIVPANASSASGGDRGPGLAPIVLFPAFHFTKLEVTVHNQRVDPACPRSGTFEDWFLVDRPSAFSQVCQDELLTLRFDPNSHKPMRLRFSEQHGVTARILDYGSTTSAPFYEPMYLALEAAGYTRDRLIPRSRRQMKTRAPAGDLRGLAQSGHAIHWRASPDDPALQAAPRSRRGSNRWRAIAGSRRVQTHPRTA